MLPSDIPLPPLRRQIQPELVWGLNNVFPAWLYAGVQIVIVRVGQDPSFSTQPLHCVDDRTEAQVCRGDLAMAVAERVAQPGLDSGLTLCPVFIQVSKLESRASTHMLS